MMIHSVTIHCSKPLHLVLEMYSDKNITNNWRERLK